MWGAESFFCLAGALILFTAKPCNGLCTLLNGTMASCHYLEDAKYIDTYDLEILKASFSREHLDDEIFQKLKSLRHLDLSHGKIESIEPKAFRVLTELRSLDLSYNRLIELPKGIFDGLNHLLSLNIRRNAFTEIPDTLLRAKSLNIIDLTGNPLNCDCATLKNRDALLARRVQLPKRILCASPSNLKSKSLFELDTRMICSLEEQDGEMRMDQPRAEGSGEFPSTDDPFGELYSVSSTTVEVETPASTISSDKDVSTYDPNGTPNTYTTASSMTSDEIFFSEEIVKRATTRSLAGEKSTEEEADEERPKMKETSAHPSSSNVATSHPVEGSGEEIEEDEAREGSGIDGSGMGVPPIRWDVPDDNDESASPEPTASSDSTKSNNEGLFDMLWGVLWSTSEEPKEENKHEPGPEDEEFINVSSEATTQSSTVKTPIAVTPPMGKSAAVNGSVEVTSDRVLDGAKSGNVRAEDSASSAEATDASATRQPKKGMGSYVVLAALLAVLGLLIGFAAYKGDFCRRRRKRNDTENGTELRDVTKSLLDSGNAALDRPKISSNGNLEDVPLEEGKNVLVSRPMDGSGTRYSAIPMEIVDPVKPPRKLYGARDELDDRANGDAASANDELVIRPRSGIPADDPSGTNGKIRPRDSLPSSLAASTESRDSPSIRASPRILTPTNGSLGTADASQQAHGRPPHSPGAQRVKITLQEIPDSVPRTPILITRTKQGENLVKTP